jgi:hypothetical protein
VKTTKHPNKALFAGVLATLDEASDKAPSGARGHRVLLTTEAAEEALHTLRGMAVGFKDDLDGHNVRQRCGVITDAWLDQGKLYVKGHIFGRDFPEVVTALGDAAKPLGMSYELYEAHVEDMRASVWKITKATFVGAAILRRDKAAYRTTIVNLSAERERFTGRLVVLDGGVRLVKGKR